MASVDRFSATTGAAADEGEESRAGFVIAGRANTTPRGKMLDATGGGAARSDGPTAERGRHERVVAGRVGDRAATAAGGARGDRHRGGEAGCDWGGRSP